jgi:hypothetical protein
MVMMMVTMTVAPMVTVMFSMRVYHNRFPALAGFVARIGRRVVLCQ